MDKLLYLLPVLACPVAMGLVMWLMMRGRRPADGVRIEADQRDREVTRLRAEVDQLRAERNDRTATSGPQT